MLGRPDYTPEQKSYSSRINVPFHNFFHKIAVAFFAANFSRSSLELRRKIVADQSRFRRRSSNLELI